MVESTFELSIGASVAWIIGLVSKMIISYLCLSSSINSSISLEASISEGFLSAFPAVKIFKYSIPGIDSSLMISVAIVPVIRSVMVLIASSRLVLFKTMSVSPGSLSIPKILYILGFRRSASTSSVFKPIWAIDTARFAAMVVFPSFATALVMDIVLYPLSINPKCTLVRSDLNASAIVLFGL